MINDAKYGGLRKSHKLNDVKMTFVYSYGRALNKKVYFKIAMTFYIKI